MDFDLRYINFIVAVSNIVFGSWTLCHIHQFFHRCIVFTVIMISTLMHMSETKHLLPGIAPLNILSWHFLQADRIMATIIGSYILYLTIQHDIEVDWRVCFIGLIFMFLSENMEMIGLGHYEGTVPGSLFFAVTHIIWHFCAFYIMKEMLE